VFLDENDCPYYVGQTSNFKERKQAHERYINNKYHINDRRYNCYKYKKARKLKREGHSFEMFIIDTAKNRKEASNLAVAMYHQAGKV
jgi:predicted GIY-YIG superfamily endonuclease